jgi:hypothetical protein
MKLVDTLPRILQLEIIIPKSIGNYDSFYFILLYVDVLATRRISEVLCMILL